MGTWRLLALHKTAKGLGLCDSSEAGMGQCTRPAQDSGLHQGLSLTYSQSPEHHPSAQHRASVSSLVDLCNHHFSHAGQVPRHRAPLRGLLLQLHGDAQRQEAGVSACTEASVP